MASLQTFSFAQWLEEAGSKGLANYSGSASYNRISWVYACVNAIARTASSAPMLFYQGTTTQSTNLISDPNHPVRQLFDSPNPPALPSLRSLLFRTFIHYGITGGGYWVFGMKGGKYVTLDFVATLEPIFKTVKGDDVLVGWTRRTSSGSEVVYTVEQVLPVLNYNPSNPYLPLSPISAARLSLESEFSIAGWNSSYFRNGMKSPILIQAKGTLTKAQKAEIRQEIVNYYSGIEGAHGALLMQGNVEVQPLVVSPKDIDFIEGKKLNREEILSVFGVPPSIVGIYEYSSYANTKEQRKIFWENTLLPIMEQILDLLQVNVLDTQFPGILAKWDTSKLIGLNPDAADVATAAKTYFDMGYPPEQIAVILNLPQLDPNYYGEGGGTQQPTSPSPSDQPTRVLPSSSPGAKSISGVSFTDWLDRYGKADTADFNVHANLFNMRARSFVDGLVKYASARQLTNVEPWQELWEDTAEKVLQQLVQGAMKSAVVAMDAVARKGRIDKTVDVNRYLSLAQQTEIVREAQPFIKSALSLPKTLFFRLKAGQMEHVTNITQHLQQLTHVLLRNLWETVRNYTYKLLGVTKHTWVCRDEDHKFLHGISVDFNEIFPVVRAAHPHQNGVLSAHVLTCSCTTVPLVFPFTVLPKH